MSDSHYNDLDRLIIEFEEDNRTIKSERIMMQNYPKVLTMSAASTFEHYIKIRCQDFIDNPKIPLDQNYPNICSLHKKPIVDAMYAKLEGYDDKGIPHLDAKKFYDLFNGQSFEANLQFHFQAELRRQHQLVQSDIEKLKLLVKTNERYELDYAKLSDLEVQFAQCTFSDAETAFLSLKLKRNRVAHDYLNGLSDTFSDIQNFYNLAQIYVKALERAIIDLTNT